jgi:hypothetical protein
MTTAAATVLTQLFYDLNEPTAFSGNQQHLVRELRKRLPNLKNADAVVRDWLASRDEFTQFRRTFHNYKTPQIRVPPTAGYQLQLDLLDMHAYVDRGYRYILVAIDCLSRYAWLQPLKTKTSKEVAFAFESMAPECKLVQTDAGKEFIGRPFQHLLEQRGIRFFTTPSNTKASMAERLIRSIKERFMRYFRAKRSTRWFHVVNEFQRSYNNSPHRSLNNLTPAKVHTNPALQGLVWEWIYRPRKTVAVKFKVGNKVRISRLKVVFEKGFTDRWSLKIYTIHSILTQHNPPMYRLVDETGELVKGAFNQAELQLVKEKGQEPVQIEMVIDVDKSNARDWRYFVKWENHPSYMNQWLRESELDLETRKLLRNRYKQGQGRAE